MKLSIVIPSYNIEKYIETCLLSILKDIADPSQVEVILIDDCSTDNTVKVASKLAKEYNLLQIIEKPKQTNAGDSRNIGLEAATGEYVWFVDGDDLIGKNGVSRVLRMLEEQSADVYFIPFLRFNDSNGYCVRDSVAYEVLSSVPKDITTLVESPELLLIMGAAWLKIIRREFILEQKISFQSVPVHNDFHFSVDCLVKASSIYVGANYTLEAWYQYRVTRENALTRVNDNRIMYLFSVLTSLRDDFLDSLNQEESCYFLQIFILNIMTRNNRIEDEDFERKYRAQAVSFLETIPYPLIKLFFQSTVGTIATKGFLFELLWDHGYFKAKNLFDGKLAVSLIVASYNTVKYLDETFAFLKELPNNENFLELIIVDDASTDGSVDYFRELEAKYSFVKFIELKENTIGGVGTPANIGIREAQGEIVAFLDSDDILYFDTFMKEVSRMYLCKSDVLVFDFLNYYDKQGTFAPSGSTKRLEEAQNPCNNLKNTLLNMNPVPWRKLYNRKYLVEKQIYFPEVDFFYEDTPFHWFAITQTENLHVSTSIVVAHRREREGQSLSVYGTEKSAPAFICHIKIIKNFLVKKGLFSRFQDVFDVYALNSIIKNHHQPIINREDLRFGFMELTLDMPRCLAYLNDPQKYTQDQEQAKQDRKWMRFGRMSWKRKIWTIGKAFSKKLHIYWLLRPFAQIVKRVVK